jgi:restriction system protein
VQAFVGSLVGHGANKGVFVTTSSFSIQAIEFADRLPHPQRVILIDGKKLTDLMIEHNVGLRSVQQVDEGYFVE